MRVLVYKDDDLLVAQCLEKDICVQGKNMDALLTSLIRTVKLEKSIDNFGKIGLAPKRFFDDWKAINNTNIIARFAI